MSSVALLGTGLLGESIGQRLLERGVSLYVWNRTRDRSQALIDAGAQALSSPSEAPRRCDSLITVLRDGPVTAAVLNDISPLDGSTLITMGTVGVTESQALAQQAAQQGGRYLEAPVLGSKPQALNGSLLVMAGGEEQIFTERIHSLPSLTRSLLVGPVGSCAPQAGPQPVDRQPHPQLVHLPSIDSTGQGLRGDVLAILRICLYAPTRQEAQRMLVTITPIPTSAPPCCARPTCSGEATTAGLQDQAQRLLTLLDERGHRPG